MKQTFRSHDQKLELTLDPSGQAYSFSATREGETLFETQNVTFSLLDDSLVEIKTERGVFRIPVVVEGDQIQISFKGQVYRFERETPQSRRRGQSAEASGLLVSPMPCLVRKVSVQEGEAVTKGQEVVVIEAMKTVQAMISPFDGSVKRVMVKENDLVDERAPLVEIEKHTTEPTAPDSEAKETP